MAVLRSALFALIFYPGTALYVAATFIGGLFGREALIRAVLAWARFHRWCAATLLGVRARPEGHCPSGPVLIAAKHQSMFEAIDFLLMLDRPAVVLKRELADIPGWGWAARAYGVIPVDRAGGAAALRRMLRAAEAAIREGRPILIFPEGTRVKPGEQPPLAAGFSGLYKALGLPVVPVALDAGRVWPKGKFVKQAGDICFVFHDPVPPGLPRKEVEARIHAAINSLEPPVPPAA
ncbi:1-acyl-sn-glycerol-3-phosphate acyltransferase [Allosphingosinicella flava]|uniref:1-acyl-sn-glycerol-3-phosphate acyltransferase n=1 Tax=Allosphingosinicella flava TaxID=2771430 RepID=A0A7T2GIN4_9SPHN|nr:lysophospholipid acyltransferase family protein [Sphingosinicella flava]QPQ54561.1 1-acyl-sn-glycerol-3-phosphate acyltransferase [Sphingosinicella flava]